MIDHASALAQEVALDVARIRQNFPALQQDMHGWPLVFLDSVASSQKPVQVLEAMEQVYRSTASRNPRCGPRMVSINPALRSTIRIWLR